MTGPIASTTSGRVEGLHRDGVDVFRGIPYARAPVGDLRFGAPRAPVPWEGVRDATRPASAPPQSGPVRAPVATDDEWLTVTVTTGTGAAATDRSGAGRDARRGGAPAPVFVWFHGGAYIAGHAADPMYDGTALARAGVVVVVVESRTGAEGFAEIAGAPSNRGFLDLVAALEWVRDNAAAFGGDADSVTIAGQSSGAGSVVALLCMPAARGLFHRAIAQSVPGMFCTPALARAVAHRLAHAVGRRPTVEDLREVDPQVLADAVDTVAATAAVDEPRWGRLTSLGVVLCPVVGVDPLPLPPWEDGAGLDAAVDLIVGHTRDEFRLFTAALDDEPLGRHDVDAAIRRHVPGPDAAAAYRSAYPELDDRTLFEVAHSDMLFRIPSLRTAQAHARAGGTTHVYEFAWSVDDRLRAFHGLDVPVLFDTMDSPTARAAIGDAPLGPDAAILGAAMRGFWVGFARTGFPDWPPFTTDRPDTCVLVVPPTVVRYPEERSAGVWSGREVAPFALEA